MIDYRKFDNIDTDSDEEQNLSSIVKAATIPKSSSLSLSSSSSNNPDVIPSDTGAPEKMTKKNKSGRLEFQHEGRTIYEWEQSLEEVNIYITPPPNIPRSAMEISIAYRHIKVGIKGAPPFIDEDTGGTVKVKESMWTLVDGEININLQKMLKGEAWNCALIGKAGEKNDPFTQEEVKKQLMIERFQEENPTFDFSSAEFNGTVPNAREFMGGVKYS